MIIPERKKGHLYCIQHTTLPQGREPFTPAATNLDTAPSFDQWQTYRPAHTPDNEAGTRSLLHQSLGFKRQNLHNTASTWESQIQYYWLL